MQKCHQRFVSEGSRSFGLDGTGTESGYVEEKNDVQFQVLKEILTHGKQNSIIFSDSLSIMQSLGT